MKQVRRKVLSGVGGGWGGDWQGKGRKEGFGWWGEGRKRVGRDLKLRGTSAMSSVGSSMLGESRGELWLAEEAERGGMSRRCSQKSW